MRNQISIFEVHFIFFKKTKNILTLRLIYYGRVFPGAADMYINLFNEKYYIDCRSSKTFIVDKNNMIYKYCDCVALSVT